MPLLADTGYHVVAPDQRGYGRTTTGWDTREFADVDLDSFSCIKPDPRRSRPCSRLGISKVSSVCLSEHDQISSKGSFLISHPFRKVPSLPIFNNKIDQTTETADGKPPSSPNIHTELASLGRKHHKWYYSTEPANSE
ncbi:uncharacterized protein PADG_12290 [Paracoccidioides brasiliensis Pb18]|uniref:Uncharacterized protein n=1 Tax=Paracoccidioides brasiliensis (strain Pb18) TaxID=502780 RepID=A0A0A0HQX4_PARBD|nr:uncharacterized protein PADG_12290 [Paracoccidioides brasiliensis Pb18]KGM91609.1 hypothetical protein PADG_12290 [Paracoccidioides brasiliensis Pb18]